MVKVYCLEFKIRALGELQQSVEDAIDQISRGLDFINTLAGKDIKDCIDDTFKKGVLSVFYIESSMRLCP